MGQNGPAKPQRIPKGQIPPKNSLKRYVLDREYDVMRSKSSKE
jgi:hypothetical protein